MLEIFKEFYIETINIDQHKPRQSKGLLSHNQLINMVKVIYIIKGQYIGTNYLS